jgi:fengycin family lipopeptide synthetase D
VVLVSGRNADKPENQQSRENYLYAYITAEQEINLSKLREYLTRQIPGYMIPDYFIQMEKLPLTTSGKIDRKVLRELRPGSARPKLEETYAAPGTNIEKIVANTWKEVLKLEKIGIHDNFFELGGNSLDIIKVNTKLKKAIGKDIRIITMFEFSTIASLSQYLQEETGERLINKKADQYEAKNINRDQLRRKRNRIRGV